MKGDDYVFDYVFRLERRGKERVAVTVKERADMGKSKFPDEFLWSYQNFLKYYGSIIEKKATPIKIASAAQIQRIKDLIEVVKISDDQIDLWFTKANIDDWSEMTSDQIQKCIDFCERRVQSLGKGGE
jgi:hypothetical protein